MRIFIVLVFMFMACAAVAAEKISLLDDAADGNSYYANPKALKMWNEFEKDTGYAFGYGSREMKIVYGKLDGGDCQDNKSWFAGAIPRAPEVIAKGILHVDAVCKGKHVTGNLDYAFDVEPKREHPASREEAGADMFHALNGTLNVDGKNVESYGEIKYKWRWDFEKPDWTSDGAVKIMDIHSLLGNYNLMFNLGNVHLHTIAWGHDNFYKPEPRPEWSK